MAGKTGRPKRYQLTAAERMHEMTVQFCPKKQVLNIATSVAILEDVDFDLLRESAAEAYSRSDAMRLRFCKGVGRNKGKIYQYFEPQETREIEFFDFSSWKPEDAEAKMREWSAVPFERFDTPLNRMVMISLPDGYKGLYLLVDHMTMDSHGIIVFLSDLIEIYCAKKYGTDYPKPLASYEEVLQKSLAYEDGSKSLERDRAFWTAFLEQPEPIFTDVTGPQTLENYRRETGNPEKRAVKITSESVDACIKVFHLETEPSMELLSFCAQRRIPMVCLLLMGLRTYLQKMNGGERDVCVKSTVSRRATLAEKKSGGTRIHYFPCRTIVEPGQTFLEGLAVVQEAQNNMFRHANFDPIELTRMRAKRFGLEPGESYESINLTYQPMSMRKKELGDTQYKCDWYSNGAAASPLYLSVMHNPLDDGLDFYFEYQAGRVSEKTLELIYYYMCRILFKGVQNPDMTVGEIIAAV